MNGLVWFRQDLRIQDNSALATALTECEQVFALFALTPKTWAGHDHSPIKLKFWLDNLQIMAADLAARGIALHIIETDYFAELPAEILQLCRRLKIGSVYYHQQYEYDERQRDQQVEQTLLARQIQVHSYHDQLIAPPGVILSSQKQAIKVFTPFKKRWLDWVSSHESWQLAHAAVVNSSPVSVKRVPKTVAGFDLPKNTGQWQAGETAAQQRLQQFCQSALYDYHLQRDFPARPGTSQLSPYLSAGVLSLRQCIVAVLNTLGEHKLSAVYLHEGPFTWLNELIWREFYKHILFHYPEVSKHQPFQAHTRNLAWEDQPTWYSAWQQGRTGFPIVDAAMRQLQQLGWMHNRLRMIVAMFFSKILLLDWRIGERHFMQQLIDGDLAANNGGWQWCASTGTDSVPYFRIFNFTTQSKKFDPQGQFIRRYCPELRHLDNDKIHEPYARGAKLSTKAYPKPIVDYKTRRELAIKAFKQLR